MLDPFPTTSWIQQEKIRCYKLKAGKLISILRCDDFSSEWNVHRPMTFTVSKAWNYYFILKQQILVEIICPFSLDFCPSTQQVNKWLYGDRLEEIRGEKCKASHKKETVSNGTCELYTKAADNIHPDNPMSAKVETENNAGNNISSLGHSTGPRPLAHQSSARVQAWSKSIGIFPQDPRELQAQAGLRVGETFKVSCESCTSQQTSVMLNW